MSCVYREYPPARARVPPPPLPDLPAGRLALSTPKVRGVPAKVSGLPAALLSSDSVQSIPTTGGARAHTRGRVGKVLLSSMVGWGEGARGRGGGVASDTGVGIPIFSLMAVYILSFVFKLVLRCLSRSSLVLGVCVYAVRNIWLPMAPRTGTGSLIPRPLLSLPRFWMVPFIAPTIACGGRNIYSR